MITIIGILAALITVAAVGALKKARRDADQGRDQPDRQRRSTSTRTRRRRIRRIARRTAPAATNPIDEAQVLTDLKRHMKQAFPRHQEPDDLIACIGGLDSRLAVADSDDKLWRVACRPAKRSCSGSAASAPIRSFRSRAKAGRRIDDRRRIGAPNERKLDPIESRKWVFPFEVDRLGPRDDGRLFRRRSNDRYIEYTVTINGVQQTRRINFWQYTPRKSEQPYLYFDTSRHPAAVQRSATRGTVRSAGRHGATDWHRRGLHVHAFKKASESASDDCADSVRQSGQVPDHPLRHRRRVGRGRISRRCRVARCRLRRPRCQLSAVPRRARSPAKSPTRS